MKKFLLFITVLLSMTLGAYAAPITGQHLEFMGIPINGSASAFGNSLKAKGFTFSSESNGYKIYSGTYYDYAADVYVRNNDDNKVYAVFVFIDTLSYETAEDIAVEIALELVEEYKLPSGDGMVMDDDNEDDNEIDFWVYNTQKNIVGIINIEADPNDGDPMTMISFFDTLNMPD